MSCKFTSGENSLLIEGGNDRDKARLKLSSVRAIAKEKNSDFVELIFNNGEIKRVDYKNVSDFDGDTDIETQDILYDKLEAVIFPVL